MKLPALLIGIGAFMLGAGLAAPMVSKMETVPCQLSQNIGELELSGITGRLGGV